MAHIVAFYKTASNSHSDAAQEYMGLVFPTPIRTMDGLLPKELHFSA
jgi:hypothetical protein